MRLDRDRADVKRLYRQLCAQTNHLTYNRTDQAQKKIGPKERDELVELIHDEAVRLETNLKTGFDKRYLAISHLAKAKAKPRVPAAGSVGTTYHANVSVVSSTTPLLSSVTHTTTPAQLISSVGPTGPAKPPGTS